MKTLGVRIFQLWMAQLLYGQPISLLQFILESQSNNLGEIQQVVLS
jgi:hypothetical protein